MQTAQGGTAWRQDDHLFRGCGNRAARFQVIQLSHCCRRHEAAFSSSVVATTENMTKPTAEQTDHRRHQQLKPAEEEGRCFMSKCSVDFIFSPKCSLDISFLEISFINNHVCNVTLNIHARLFCTGYNVCKEVHGGEGRTGWGGMGGRASAGANTGSLFLVVDS